jgi:hypothetical protein
MTRTRLVALTIIALGFASGAFAQSVDDTYQALQSPRPTLRMDPLDPVLRVAMLAENAGIASPTTSDRFVFLSTPEPPAPAVQSTRTVVEERPSGQARFFSAVQGIRAGLQVSHEALDVYEHAIEANALKNYYNNER